MAKLGDVRVEYVPLSQVEKAPRNPKLHDTESIGASVERFGFVQPVIVDERTGRLVAGHGRLETLRKMKDSGKRPPMRILVEGDEWYVPVVRGVAFANDKEAEAYLIADNRQVELGGWDDSMLSDMLRGLNDEALLDGTGYSPSDIDAMLAPPAEARIAQVDRKDRYDEAEIKQIVLYFDGATFDSVVARLSRIMAERGLTSHTQVFETLLEAYEASTGTASTGS
jgi:ParB-like chromosome segregation protein Spo0J